MLGQKQTGGDHALTAVFATPDKRCAILANWPTLLTVTT